jgi:hypothetical protein
MPRVFVSGISGCLVLLITGCSQKEGADSSSNKNPPIAKSEVISKQTETVVAEKPVTITKENDAIDLVRKRIQIDKLYEWNNHDECLAYVIETATESSYDVGVHENHQGRCGGDKGSFPIIDRFRVERGTGTIMWYNFENGEYVGYSAMKSVKKKTR